MGKKKRIAAKRKANQSDVTPLHLKKQKTLDLSLTENPSRSSPHNIGPVNLLAINENQKRETTLPLESVKKKKKQKKKKKKTSDLPETASPVESVRKKKKKRGSKNKTGREIFKEHLNGILYFKDKHLDELLEKLSSSIEAMRHPKGKVYDNIWMKQSFSVGINDVTRTLERMPVALDKPIESYISDFNSSPDRFPNIESDHEDNGPKKQFIGRETETQGKGVHLQAVLTAVDCHPRVLVSHLPGLASSRGVPLFSVEDHGTGSERLGQLLKLKTAIAIGVKVGESTINKSIQGVIDDQ
ncbi:hypothetical protein KI387_028149, partial [Taxus chinensis]